MSELIEVLEFLIKENRLDLCKKIISYVEIIKNEQVKTSELKYSNYTLNTLARELVVHPRLLETFLPIRRYPEPPYNYDLKLSMSEVEHIRIKLSTYKIKNTG